MTAPSRAQCSDLGIGVPTKLACEGRSGDCPYFAVGFFEGFAENLCEQCGARSFSYWLMIEAVRAGIRNPAWYISGADWSAA